MFKEQLAAYFRGERNDAIIAAIIGLFILTGCLLMWRSLNTNLFLKGFFYPLAFLGVFTFSAGVFNSFNNTSRMKAMAEAYEKTPKKLVEKEFNRFEGKYGVNSWWLPLRIFWAALILAGLCIMAFSNKQNLQGVAAGLMLIGTFGFIIDGHAKHRADIYMKDITTEMQFHKTQNDF